MVGRSKEEQATKRLSSIQRHLIDRRRVDVLEKNPGVGFWKKIFVVFTPPWLSPAEKVRTVQ